MTCQICYDTFPDMYKVTCGSTVDHMICFGCEKQWREKMPVREGERKMTCPTCRQVETSRTLESLQREVTALYGSRPAPSSTEEWQSALRVILRLGPIHRALVARALLGPTPLDEPAPAPAPPAAPAPAVPAARSTRPPVRVFCESGRDCRTMSRIHDRTKTHLKCRGCQVVACCSTCRVCTGCRPLDA